MSRSPPPEDSARAQTAARPRGRVADRYVLAEKLAQGGMGIVFRAVERATNEVRALKRMTPDAAKEPALVEAFEREYQVLAGLDHPRIIRVFDYGVDEQGPYYTMELLDGRDMRKAAPLPYQEACLYLRDVATSLALLHARRLIHRDLSPANVRMTLDGHCKLLDFGALSAFGHSSLVVGTPPGIPPEVLAGAPLDQRTDLYALGALAYWMLTGRHAYPARELSALQKAWATTPPPPSAFTGDSPQERDTLVLSLLSADPLARPASAAEVIARLNAIAALPPEGDLEAARLAHSFLKSPRFTGRAAEIDAIVRMVHTAARGEGAAMLIESVPGMGRTRLLEEIGLRAQIAGAAVLRVDASMYRHANGTARALALRLLDATPDRAREHGRAHRAALAVLGNEVEARLPPRSVPPLGTSAELPLEGTSMLAEWFVAISRHKPIVIEVDNVEHADDASLGLLAGLADLARSHPIAVIATERQHTEARAAVGLASFRARCTSLSLGGLAPAETLELARSIFGDAPNVERFAGWMHGLTAGSPLHFLEVTRQLVAKQRIRYAGGIWMLPVERPDAELPGALEDALHQRVRSLGEDARRLAECLSLQTERPTLGLCRMLTDGDERHVLVLLDELSEHDVLYADADGYRFSSMAIREALLGGMNDARREAGHRRLGQAFRRLAGDDDPGLRLRAGWHLIRGGEDVAGAEMIAEVTHDSVTLRRVVADLNHVGHAIEAALAVYKRDRRSMYERMPLLAALAYVGYYEDRGFGDRYGDEALDVLEHMAGLGLARRASRFVGRTLGLFVGLVVALLRFHLVPARERRYSFKEVLVQLFAVVTSLTGVASLSLDTNRATRVAAVLEPFSVLPERLTPVGIYQYCVGLSRIGVDDQAAASALMEKLLARFKDPKYYPTLPAHARPLYVTACHFARGSFAVFREDGRAALESADELDAAGLKLYSMVASQLRFLYHMNRGEVAKAAPHRDQVELHAAHVGSAWQVETWEAAALMPVFSSLWDVVSMTRAADRLELLCRTVPSLKMYSRLADGFLQHVRKDLLLAAETTLASLEHVPPRGITGWAAILGFAARSYNELGRHVEARAIAERALGHMTDEDRDYVSLYLVVDIEAAVADAGIGDFEAAFARIDGLIARFRRSDHPLVHGFLHEARARIALLAGRFDEYELSLSQVERWFRPTGTSALVSRCERLAALRRRSRASPYGLMVTEGLEPSGTRLRDHESVATLSDAETVHAVRR